MTVKKKIIRTETYKKGVYIEKQEVIKWLQNSLLNPQILNCSRYNDDSESFTIKITLTNEEIQKMT